MSALAHFRHTRGNKRQHSAVNGGNVPRDSFHEIVRWTAAAHCGELAPLIFEPWVCGSSPSAGTVHLIALPS